MRIRVLLAALLTLLLWAAAQVTPSVSIPRGGLVGVVPPTDPITALLAVMPAHSWVKLTTSSPAQGNFVGVQQTRDCADFDGAAQASGTPCTGAGASIWASNAAVAAGANGGGIGAANAGNSGADWAFSTSMIRDTDGEVCHTGGGHVDSGSSAFSCFNSKTAAASILASSSGGSWTLVTKGAMYISISSPEPAWSFQTTPQNETNFVYWAAQNKDGQNRSMACHSYFMNFAINGTTKWANNCSTGGYSHDAVTHNAAAELLDDTASGAQLIHITGMNCGYGPPTNCGGGPGDFSDVDSNYYASDGNTGNIYRWATLTGTPTNTLVVTCSGLMDFGVNIEATVMYDVTNASPSTHRAFFSLAASHSNFIYASDILSGGSPSCGAAHAFASGPPSFIQGNNNNGETWDSNRNEVVFWDGGQYLYPITTNSNLAAWNWAKESVTPSGYRGSSDIPNIAGASGNFTRIKYLPSYDAYLAAVDGDVWLRKP